VSDASQGPGWWLASDGKWYPPDQVPGPATPPEPVTPVTPAATPPITPPAAPVVPTPVVPPPVIPAAAPPAAPPPAAPAPPPAAPPPGGYTPPPTQASSAPPPAKKSGNGCLKAFLIVFVIVVVLGIGLFVVLGFVVKKGVDSVNSDINAEKKVEQRTGISSNPLFFNSKHPPQDDISTDSMKCTTDSSGNMQASGTVTNHSSNTSTYTVTISFRQNGSEVGTGTDVLPSVDAGATATWTANSVTTANGSFTCKITEVDRFDINTFISTTTTR
jgi:hypothetical protein